MKILQTLIRFLLWLTPVPIALVLTVVSGHSFTASPLQDSIRVVLMWASLSLPVAWIAVEIIDFIKKRKEDINTKTKRRKVLHQFASAYAGLWIILLIAIVTINE